LDEWKPLDGVGVGGVGFDTMSDYPPPTRAEHERMQGRASTHPLFSST
jgi:hypothetical protein